MPARQPGSTFHTAATKEVVHGNPCVELQHAGIAHKSTQAVPAVPNVANATAARNILIGEQMVIHMDGMHEFPSALLPGGAKVGDRLFIKHSNNALVAVAAGAAVDKIVEEGTHTKFGVLDEIDTVGARAHVNLTQRSSF